jgi:hypothetical protein
MTRASRWAGCAVAAVASVFMAWFPGGASAKETPTPILFVHGNSGSAQQFETNAMRFTSNGFPQARIFAYEYDTTTPNNDVAISNLETYVEEIKADTGAKKIDILAHSRGTTVMHAYLSDPERARSVKHYVNFDGRTRETPPGDVPTLAIWGEGDQTREIGGAKNIYYPGKAHTEVTTSAAAYGKVYRFLRGRKARTTGVTPQKPRNVTVAGRGLLFPSNVGNAGALVEVFEVDPETGQRVTGEPLHSLTLPEDGSFGPLPVNGRKHYEFAVERPGVQTLHTYFEPFERSDHFVRLLDAPALRPFATYSPQSTNVVVLRMREFWGGQPNPRANDVLKLDGLDVINENTTPRERRILAVFTYDAGLDGESDTSQSLPPFSELGFLTGIDVFMPASLDASGTIPVHTEIRRKRNHEETLNVPNWPSHTDVNVTFFKDYVAKTFARR